MIVLDTNVTTEVGKSNPNQNVMDWFANQNLIDLYITVANEAELRYGVEKLPVGRRRNEVAATNDRIIDQVLGGRVLPFNRESARAYGEIRAGRERAGHSIQDRDCMIAAVARVNGAFVATRDTRGFENCGIEVIDPWES